MAKGTSQRKSNGDGGRARAHLAFEANLWAKNSVSSNQSGEGEIRKAIIESFHPTAHVNQRAFQSVSGIGDSRAKL